MRRSIDLQSNFRALPGPVLVLRPDVAFTIVAATADYLRTAHTDESIIGQPLFEVFPDNPAIEGADGSMKLRESLLRVLATRSADVMALQRYDVRLPEAEGGSFEERYWLPTNTPVLDEAGEVELIVHRVEDAAAKGNRGAVGILESITEGFFTLDRQWRFNYVNSEAHRILDCAPGSLAGRVLWDAYPGLQGTAFEENYLRTMLQREKTSFTAYYPLQERWYEVTTFAAAEGVSVYFRDVTEQKKLQAQRDALMVESERQQRIYEAALDNTPDFVYVFDIDHRALYANAALLKTWGVDDVRGKRWIDLGYEPWHADLHDREIDEVIRTKAPIRGEIHFTGTSGRRLYDYIFAPVLDAKAKVVAVAGTTRDITERQMLTQRMLDSQRLEAVGTLASGVAHDFNNALAAILGNLALAQQDLAPDSAVIGRLQLVRRAAERARSLVRQILSFSRRAPKQVAMQQPLQPLLDEAMAMLHSTLPPSVQLNASAAEQAFWARVDGAKFQQVLVNLCTNSWQAMGDRPGVVNVSLVSVSLTPAEAAALGVACGTFVKLQVADNGPGMDEAVRNRMFEPFFTTKPLGQGTGLGLAIVHGFVAESGGVIQVESAPGRGTAVSVFLPSLSPQPAQAHSGARDAGAAAEASPSVPGVGNGGARILYIDDDEVVLVTATALLERAGFSVTCAADGPSALQALRRTPDEFDVVVTDFNMPGMSGLSVADAVRGEVPSMPIIVISGLVTDELHTAAREHGVREVVPKEDMLERLVDAVARARAPAPAP